MYTGRPIDLEKMLRDNKTYDIDHIYPQSKVMDDSLDNRVLVEKIYNQEKTDIYPIDEKIRKKMRHFGNLWRMVDLFPKRNING